MIFLHILMTAKYLDIFFYLDNHIIVRGFPTPTYRETKICCIIKLCFMCLRQFSLYWFNIANYTWLDNPIDEFFFLSFFFFNKKRIKLMSENFIYNLHCFTLGEKKVLLKVHSCGKYKALHDRRKILQNVCKKRERFIKLLLEKKWSI